METTVKLYSLNFRQAKTYWFTLLFVAGNLILPQLCHLIPQGGLILLPIYFFTLIAAYKFGIRVGLLTAVLSPLANSALFGMPAAAVLPEILIKSVTLAVAAAMAARYLKSVSLLAMGRRRTGLPDHRLAVRMGPHGQLPYRHAGFPSRRSGHVVADHSRVRAAEMAGQTLTRCREKHSKKC